MGNEFYPLGIAVGLSSGLLWAMLFLNGNPKTIEKKVEMPMQPTAIVKEYRNDDKLLDIVQKYQDGSEVILYAHRDEQGNIEYNLKK